MSGHLYDKLQKCCVIKSSSYIGIAIGIGVFIADIAISYRNIG